MGCRDGEFKFTEHGLEALTQSERVTRAQVARRAIVRELHEEDQAEVVINLLHRVKKLQPGLYLSEIQGAMFGLLNDKLAVLKDLRIFKASPPR